MMLASERHEIILSLVRQQGSVRLADLVARLGVTSVTVRRDVTELADRGLLTRVHGGVTLARPRGGQAEPGRGGAPSVYGHAASGALVGMVGAMAVRYWFAARSLGFAIHADGTVVALPEPVSGRLKRVARGASAP